MGAMLGRLIANVGARWYVSAVYPAGLALLIPLVGLWLFPERADLPAPGNTQVLGWTVAVMLGSSFLVSLIYGHSVGGSLKALGWLTFLPGVLGVILSIYGRDAALAYLARTVPRFDTVQDLVMLYLDRAVPTVRWLTVGFFVLGALLLVAGGRLSGSSRR